jgi:hypothetical protein
LRQRRRRRMREQQQQARTKRKGVQHVSTGDTCTEAQLWREMLRVQRTAKLLLLLLLLEEKGDDDDDLSDAEK